MFVPTPQWQRAVIAAVLIVPLIPLVTLSAPAWLAWPFLSATRQKAVLQFLDRIVEWIKAVSRIR